MAVVRRILTDALKITHLVRHFPSSGQSCLLRQLQGGVSVFAYEPPCNCRNKHDCPLEGKRRTKCVIYKASVCIPDGKTMSYYGCCETDFKARYCNHKQSFKTSSKRHQTELSRLVWRLKDEEHIPVVKWSIVCNAKPYSSGAMHCQLCLAEKLAILWVDPDTTLNKRSELVAKCRHCNKHKLIKIPP